MPLVAGSRLGPYEILAPLGAGGMGEVYRARDTKLTREVAVKVLPADPGSDPAALARFQREARAVAALSHPNILAIYGFGDAGGVTYAVTELLSGESLRQRLDRGAMPQKRSVEVAREIALGLAAAHESGIVHRDLKPENLFLTKDRVVKILDFGLAKQLRTGEQGGGETLTDHSEAGSVLGTVGYMSPEQVRGEKADHRSDIFSFGAVLYEMLSGRRAFKGETSIETMHAILKEEPSWEAVKLFPPALQRILAHCLEKSPADRFQSARDLSFALGEISNSAVPGTAVSKIHPWARRAIGIGLVATAVVAVLVTARHRPASSPFVYATISMPEGVRIAPIDEESDLCLAISPDGRTIVFSGVHDGVARLYRRALGAARAEPIPGTEHGSAPFFSPDGQWIGFFNGEELKKVPLSGGTAVTLAPVPPINPGATWGRNGRIVYTRAPNGELWWVSEAGGNPQRLTRVGPDSPTGDQAHLYPQILPGDRALLFTIRSGRDFQEVEKSSVAILEVLSGKKRILLEGATFARYGGGRVVFLRGEKVFSAPFDVSKLEVTGPVSALDQPIAADPSTAMAFFDVAAGGNLVFLDGPPLRGPTNAVLRLNRAGKMNVLPLPAGSYSSPRFSPDGKRVALCRLVGAREEIVVWDEERGIVSTLTPEPGRYFSPIWSPDGTRIAFSQFRSGPPSIGRKRSDGGGEIEPVTRPSENAEDINSWSPDGKTIAYTMLQMTTSEREPIRKAYSTDVWLVGSDGSPVSRPWFETSFHESAASFSPDGKWIAYVSDESGTNEVFVRSYPDGGTRVKVSSGQGAEPVWTRGGRELIYRTGSQRENFMSVDIASPTLTVSAPRLLFTADLVAGRDYDVFREYDVSADGNSLVALRDVLTPAPERRLIVVTDWASTQPR